VAAILLITGSSGIAEAAALEAGREGWRVFVVGREEAECVQLSERARGSAFFVADLRDEQAVQNAFQSCVERFGGIGAVFNVAGSSGRRFGDGPVHECTLEGWEATFAANTRPSFLVSRAAVRHWLNTKTPGALLNVSSVLAFSPEPSHFATHAYAAAKGAIISMSRAMAAQYASKGIRVNVLAPALVRTPMSARAQADMEIASYVERKQPLSRGFLEASDIAETALFLLSEKARHITGQVVTVDGGWTL
jgi:NAD(P)-dependent dehydrogenase (short-subunit alcohol dehydrogenase family)